MYSVRETCPSLIIKKCIYIIDNFERVTFLLNCEAIKVKSNILGDQCPTSILDSHGSRTCILHYFLILTVHVVRVDRLPRGSKDY